jgi:hypothetical protein
MIAERFPACVEWTDVNQKRQFSLAFAFQQVTLIGVLLALWRLFPKNSIYLSVSEETKAVGVQFLILVCTGVVFGTFIGGFCRHAKFGAMIGAGASFVVATIYALWCMSALARAG